MNRYIALSGLRNFSYILTQGYASLHPGLRVRRPFRTMNGTARADIPDPSVTLRFTQGFGSGQDKTGGTLTPLRRGGFFDEFGSDEDGGEGVRSLFGRRKSGGKIVH